MLKLKQGDQFAGCRIISVCGSGGMGVVYLAKDAFDRTVALKIVSIPDTERELRGIRKYIQISKNSTNLIQIYHAGIENDELFYIMEAADPLENTGDTYVPKTLSAVLSRSGKLSPDDALAMIHSLAAGLKELHRSELIHRDIKPENIIFVGNVPKLCDPGLVCEMEATASFVGTLGYLPHECFSGLNLNTPERDIYALGKVFYVAMTGEAAARYPYLPQDLPLNIRRQFWPVLTRVCENNPKSRFHTVDDFCQALPRELPKQTGLDLMRESFRQWRLSHPGTMFALFLILFFALIACAGGSAFYIYKQKQETARQLELQRQETARLLEAREKEKQHQSQLRNECDALEKPFRTNETMLLDQIAAVAGEEEAQTVKTTLQTLPLDLGQRLEILKKLHQRIRKIALGEIPEIPEKGGVNGIHKISSGVRGLFASPLGGWISEQEKTVVRKKLIALESSIYTAGIALRPGKEFTPDPSFRLKYVYVPAGSYRNKKGEIVRIPSAFWCSDGEIRIDYYNGMNNKPETSIQPDFPMTKFSWNDLLSYCYYLTVTARKQGTIPDGFIFRPLTTREWEWAYRGAWAGLGNPTPLLKETSGGRVHPAATGMPNNLGIYNMIGNVMEITMSDLDSGDDYCARISGGWYSNTTVDPEKHILYLKYQFLPPYIGSRVVIAPGNLDFFEKHLWATGPRQLKHNGTVYELLTSNEAIIELKPARQLCLLLGGKLFVPDSAEILKKLKTTFFEIGSFPVVIDGYLSDGKWHRPDGKLYSGFPMPSPPKFETWSLAFHGGSVICFNMTRLPGMICQWTPEEYANRTNLERIRKTPGILHSFEYKGKLYILFPFKSHNFVIRRIADLLGARLAEPKTPELRALFQKELAPWKDKMIMLGGVWTHDRWLFHDKSKFDLPLELKGTVFRNSLHSASIGLFNGEYCALQKGQLFLLEFSLEPNRSAASGISKMH